MAYLLYSKGKSFVFFISWWELECEDFHSVLQDLLSKVWKPGQKNKTLVVMDCLNFYWDVIRRVFSSNNPMRIKCNNKSLQISPIYMCMKVLKNHIYLNRHLSKTFIESTNTERRPKLNKGFGGYLSWPLSCQPRVYVNSEFNLYLN